MALKLIIVAIFAFALVKRMDDFDLTSDYISKPLRHHRLSLWTFLYELVENREKKHIIKWIDEEELTFKILDGNNLAQEWGNKKGRNNMTYPKFLRALRYYYGKEILEKVSGIRSTYQFIRSSKTNDILPQRSRQQIRRQSSSYVEDLIKDINSVGNTDISYTDINYPHSMHSDENSSPDPIAFTFPSSCEYVMNKQENVIESPFNWPIATDENKHFWSCGRSLPTLDIPYAAYNNFEYIPQYFN